MAGEDNDPEASLMEGTGQLGEKKGRAPKGKPQQAELLSIDKTLNQER